MTNYHIQKYSKTLCKASVTKPEINRQPCGNFQSLGKNLYPWLVDEVEAGEIVHKDDAETWKKKWHKAKCLPVT